MMFLALLSGQIGKNPKADKVSVDHREVMSARPYSLSAAEVSRLPRLNFAARYRHGRGKPTGWGRAHCRGSWPDGAIGRLSCTSDAPISVSSSRSRLRISVLDLRARRAAESSSLLAVDGKHSAFRRSPVSVRNRLAWVPSWAFAREGGAQGGKFKQRVRYESLIYPEFLLHRARLTMPAWFPTQALCRVPWVIAHHADGNRCSH